MCAQVVVVQERRALSAKWISRKSVRLAVLLGVLLSVGIAINAMIVASRRQQAITRFRRSGRGVVLALPQRTDIVSEAGYVRKAGCRFPPFPRFTAPPERRGIYVSCGSRADEVGIYSTGLSEPRPWSGWFARQPTSCRLGARQELKPVADIELKLRQDITTAPDAVSLFGPVASELVGYLGSIAMTAAATVVAVGVDSKVTIPNLSLVFVVPVIIAGVSLGLGPVTLFGDTWRPGL